MKMLEDLRVKIFADGADKAAILALYQNHWLMGFTTNPTLMHKAGVMNYETFAEEILSEIRDKPISFEVFSDDFREMHHHALYISRWADNVHVKIPVTNTKGESSIPLIRELAKEGVKQNVTAMMTLQQTEAVTEALSHGPSAYISIFAGRIADTGRDPVPIMQSALAIMRPYSQLELIWASPRELLNVFQADDIGCHIITVTPDILKKLSLLGKDLNEYSLETVRMFYNDAKAAGYTLPVKK